MTRRGVSRALWLGLWGAVSLAAAQTPPAAPGAPAAPLPDTAELLRRLDQLEAQNQELRTRVTKLEQDAETHGQQLQQLLPLAGRISGYLDFGFFWVQGRGEGIQTDTGHFLYPQYSDTEWVFTGDPLSTAINSRGDPADAQDSRAITFDPIRSGGAPSFIVNNVNLQLFAGIGDDLTFNAMIDFLPRGRVVGDKDFFNAGDYVDVKLAYAEYTVPWDRVHLTLSAGKFDSVLGYEYRAQESPDRITITPSLACRYTCGRPLGVKARARFFDDTFIVNLAVTNGSSFKESFGFYDETDINFWKTVSTRVSYKLPVGAGLEIGLSGMVGAQDGQRSDRPLQYHLGADAHMVVEDWEVAAEYVRGHAPGSTRPDSPEPCDEAPCITYQSAYGLVGWRANNWLMPYLRIDWRDALHTQGVDFRYISKLVRATVGARVELGTQVIIKAEYVFNEELPLLPDYQFANDVFTSSLVIRY